MKAQVWLDEFYLYIEFTNEQGEIITHEQYGNTVPFTKEYVENYLTYLVGECTIQYM